MIDARREAVLIWEKDGFKDRTDSVHRYSFEGSRTRVWFKRSNGPDSYSYSAERVLVLQSPVLLDPTSVSLIHATWGQLRDVVEILVFGGQDDGWIRVFRVSASGEQRHELYPASEVDVVTNLLSIDPRAADVFAYFRSVVAALGSNDSLAYPYGQLKTVDPRSVLGRYLSGQPIEAEPDDRLSIFPFLSSMSQREAVSNALRHPISVIEGPPGTGKTQTILNLIATLVATPGTSVGVVSFNNAAVENVRDKLAANGFGYVVADLRRTEVRDEFFEGQSSRNGSVDEMLAEIGEDAPAPQELREVADALDRLQQDELRLAQFRQELAAYNLEFRHFSQYLEGQEVTDIDGLPLLRRSSDRILDFLAETQIDEERHAWPTRWFRRLRWLVQYGPLGDVDHESTDVVLVLQRAYYEQKIEELTSKVAKLERHLRTKDLAGLAARYQELSVRYLAAGLRQRYGTYVRNIYEARSLQRDFDAFVYDYPVILSTCHSLRNSVREGRLLDYLIIDEASQVDLLAAGLALASCRRVIVVGDTRQLSHIADQAATKAAGPAPFPAYDYSAHSVLSSMLELHKDALPRTLLREHYRCDPAIIGFCNEKFYGGQLIPLTRSKADGWPLVLHPTAAGSHMRSHAGGGRSNRREIDVIKQEILEELKGYSEADLGITTPYRRQADELAIELATGSERAEDGLNVKITSDTVHRFQGREKPVIVMTTVLDETWRGKQGVDFVDDPRLVNVAVSRATEKFILVTDNEMLPTSRNLRDLMEYIRYHGDPKEYSEQSDIVSVFDLLYKNYSAKLKPLAARLRGEQRYLSEDIVWTVLHDILTEEQYGGLEVQPQVLLRNLLPNLQGLTADEVRYVKHRASLDFVVYRRISRRPLLVIEVDGFAFHEDNPKQLARDALKDSILSKRGLPLLRLRTTESGEPERIRNLLDKVLVEHA